MAVFGLPQSSWNPPLEGNAWPSNSIEGCLFQMGAIAGYATSITANLAWADYDIVAKCAIYDANGVFVGSTEELALPGQQGGWHPRQFNFSSPGPYLAADAFYYIVIWTNGGILFGLQADSNKVYRMRPGYYYTPNGGVFPQMFSPTVDLAERVCNIFCTYSEGGTPPPSCSDYTNQTDCLAAGCYWWSDGTCHDASEEQPDETLKYAIIGGVIVTIIIAALVIRRKK